jgi:tetratricopeptide (TPR) repeat protein
MKLKKNTFNFLSVLRSGFFSFEKESSAKSAVFKILLPAILLLLLLLLFWIWGQKNTKGNNKAVKCFNRGDFKTASEMFNKELEKQPSNCSILNNAAGAEYKLDKFDEAGEKYNAVTESSGTGKEEKFTAFYGLGNAEYKKGNFQRASDLYKQALKLNPNDKDAKYNLEMALLRLNEQSSQKNNKEQDKSGNNNNKQDDSRSDKQKKQYGKENEQDKQDKPDDGADKNKDSKNKREQKQEGNSKDKKEQDAQGQSKFSGKENKKDMPAAVILNYYDETDRNSNKQRNKYKIPVLNQPQKDW